MNIKIYGENIEVTPAISEYIHEKFKHVHKPEKLQAADFKIGIEKNMQYVQFDAQILKEHIHIELKNDNLYSAIDEIMDKIKIKFNKVKEKPAASRYKTIN